MELEVPSKSGPPEYQLSPLPRRRGNISTPIWTSLDLAGALKEGALSVLGIQVKNWHLLSLTDDQESVRLKRVSVWGRSACRTLRSTTQDLSHLGRDLVTVNPRQTILTSGPVMTIVCLGNQLYPVQQLTGAWSDV